MYTKYWQLNRKPFEIGSDPYFYYPSENYQSVLLKLRYTIENRHGSAVLRGTPGIGKSMLIEMLKQYQTTSAELGPFVTLIMPQLTAPDLLCYLADNLQNRRKAKSSGPTEPRIAESSGIQLHTALSTVEHFLFRNAAEKKHTVLVMEDSHQIHDPNVYPMLKSLLGLQTAGRPLLSLLMTTSRTESEYTDEARSAFLDDVMETVAELGPFSESDTTAYVGWRLEKAGAKEEIFTPDAMNMIYYLTGGNPRKINRLCDLALLIGFAENLKELNGNIIDALNNELIEAN